MKESHIMATSPNSGDSESRVNVSDATIRKLGDLVNWHCSNPDCCAPTKGPQITMSYLLVA
jgi:hypothetical protein